MKKLSLTLVILLGLTSMCFGQDWNYTPVSMPSYPYGLLSNFSSKVYFPYTNGNNYIRAATSSNYTYFDSQTGVGIGHQNQYSGYMLHVQGKTNLAGDVGISIGSGAPTETLDVNGTGYFHEELGIGSSPSANDMLYISSEDHRGIYAFSSDWDGGEGANIIGGRLGVLGIAGAYHTTGSQPAETYGVWGIATVGEDLSCGVHGDGTGESTGYAFGVWGTATAAGVAGYGVYGTGSAGAGSFYAGYFAGNVYTTGSYLPSDKKLKENIKPLSKLERLLLLQAKEYKYKTDEYKSMNLEEGVQMGFIAQDVEKVFPELIKETIQPPSVDEEGHIIGEGISFKAINYVGLIPILTATIQEQQKTIIQQEESITELNNRLIRLENQINQTNIDDQIVESEAVLFQNAPNPFNENTVIKYSLPKSAKMANIMVFDMSGVHKLTLPVELSSDGKTTLNAKQLTSGMYIYTLVVDGIEVASKRMIITE